MGKRSHRHRTRGDEKGKARRHSSGSGAGINFLVQPIARSDYEKHRADLIVNAAVMMSDFSELNSELLQLLRTVHPAHLIAILSHYGLLSPTSTGKRATEAPLMSGILQHHVELVQAYALHLRADEWGQQPASKEDIDRAPVLVPALATAFHARRFLDAQNVELVAERYQLLLREKIRLHTQIVRTWGHSDLALGATRKLYGPLDCVFHAELGFTVSNVIDVAVCLIALHEQRATADFAGLKKVFAERTHEGTVRRYFEHFMPGEDAGFYLQAVPADWPLTRIRAQLVGHSDILLAARNSYSVADIAEKTSIEGSVVTAIMDALAHEPGALDERDTEHFFLSNPVWLRPALKSGSDYFVATPQTILSYLDAIVRGLATSPKLKHALEERRSRFLEEEVAELMGAQLDGARILSQLRWSDGERTYESDCIVVHDGALLIVEAKSGSLSEAGLRGAPDRLKRHVDDLIVHPSEQSSRLEDLIRRAQDGDQKAVEAAAALDTDMLQVSEIVRISVTLEDFTIIAASENEMRLAGWVPDNLSLGYTISLANLKAVAQILDHDAQFIHYLAERQSLQQRAQLLGDEMDMLGLYLKTGLNSAVVERGWPLVSVSGMSADIDRWFAAGPNSGRLPKPRLAMHPYFAKVGKAIDGHARAGRLGIALDILRAFGIDEQTRIVRGLEKLKKQANGNRTSDKTATLTYAPAHLGRTAIAFHVYPRELRDRRHELSHRLGKTILEDTGRRRCLLIGRDTSRWQEAYSYLTVIEASS